MTKPQVAVESVTHEVIAVAALAILRREGTSALSFRRVAEEVGTSHVTVYRRCGSSDALLDVSANYVAADFPEVDGGLGAAAATQARFEAAYEMWAEHADLVLLMRGRSWLGENIMSRFYEPCMQSLVGAGMSIRDASRLFSVLHRMTIGSVILTKAYNWNPWEANEAIEKLGGADRFPTLGRVQREVEWSDMSANLPRHVATADPRPRPDRRRARWSSGAETAHWGERSAPDALAMTRAAVTSAPVPAGCVISATGKSDDDHLLAHIRDLTI